MCFHWDNTNWTVELRFFSYCSLYGWIAFNPRIELQYAMHTYIYRQFRFVGKVSSNASGTRKKNWVIRHNHWWLNATHEVNDDCCREYDRTIIVWPFHETYACYRSSSDRTHVQHVLLLRILLLAHWEVINEFLLQPIKLYERAHNRTINAHSFRLYHAAVNA